MLLSLYSSIEARTEAKPAAQASWQLLCWLKERELLADFRSSRRIGATELAS